MSSPVVVPLALGIGPPEIILIILVLVLLFGAKKLPELARGSGRALRIFKAETKGLLDDDEKTDEQRQIEAMNRDSARRVERPVEHPAEQPRRDDGSEPGR